MRKVNVHTTLPINIWSETIFFSNRFTWHTFEALFRASMHQQIGHIWRTHREENGRKDYQPIESYESMTGTNKFNYHSCFPGFPTHLLHLIQNRKFMGCCYVLPGTWFSSCSRNGICWWCKWLLAKNGGGWIVVLEKWSWPTAADGEVVVKEGNPDDAAVEKSGTWVTPP